MTCNCDAMRWSDGYCALIQSKRLCAAIALHCMSFFRARQARQVRQVLAGPVRALDDLRFDAIYHRVRVEKDDAMDPIKRFMAFARLSSPQREAPPTRRHRHRMARHPVIHSAGILNWATCLSLQNLSWAVRAVLLLKFYWL